MAKKKKKPGVLIYFDIAPAIKSLTDEQAGKVFKAILDYAETGEFPEFSKEDEIVRLFLVFIKSHIDRDTEAYNTKVESRKYARYCRAMKEIDMIPMEYEEWRISHAEIQNKEE